MAVSGVSSVNSLLASSDWRTEALSKLKQLVEQAAKKSADGTAASSAKTGADIATISEALLGDGSTLFDALNGQSSGDGSSVGLSDLFSVLEKLSPDSSSKSASSTSGATSDSAAFSEAALSASSDLFDLLSSSGSSSSSSSSSFAEMISAALAKRGLDVSA